MKIQCVSGFLVLNVLMTYFRAGEGHGYLMDPPARSSMWRENFQTPPNYNDNQLNCGGYYNQWSRNRGKCGICGDAFQQPQPRDNESGGKYGLGIISRTYTQGQEVTFKVMITANHFGWFEFRLCPDGSPTTPVTEACLNKYLLQLADGSGTRFNLGSARHAVSVRLRLPADVTCAQCVVQWKWHAGNNYGVNPDLSSCMGCGPQEEFYGCADISITGNGNSPTQTFPNAPVTNPATFAPVNFQTFPTVPNVQARTTRGPSTPKPTVSIVKPGSSGGFMPITLPNSASQTASTGRPKSSTLPSGFVALSPVPSNSFGVGTPSITKLPFITTDSTSRPTPILIGRTTQKPATPSATVFRTTRRQTPRPTVMPVSFQPITPHPTAPFTRGPQTTTAKTTVYRPPITLAPFVPISTVRGPLVPLTIKNPPASTQSSPTPRPPLITFYRPSSTTTVFPSVRTRAPPSSTIKPIIFTLGSTTPKPTTSSTSSTTTTVQQPVPINGGTMPQRLQGKTCYGINSWAGNAQLDQWCHAQCNTMGGTCPPEFCECV
ncbi:hypothetical protein PoB_000946400 [Plakobranchus ocellatus]|uniref:Chitin-binding type-4 domain-containing protein n=1 Tax=Plakobranchus ocellatus TaxID=259542 RepID=A0AAV3YLP0_9GAST|nr:hypothetical protein PoB_000946400 [Plakobranchus ocellatus]